MHIVAPAIEPTRRIEPNENAPLSCARRSVQESSRLLAGMRKNAHAAKTSDKSGIPNSAAVPQS